MAAFPTTQRQTDAPSAPDGAHSVTEVWYWNDGEISLRTGSLPRVQEGFVRVDTLFSGVSRGTERLVFRGEVPPSEFERMRCPNQSGEFPFPVKYGYALVGRITDGASDLHHKRVFALHPHQSAALVRRDNVVVVPDHVPSRRAVLAANMETALNVVWDSGLSLGDTVVVVGGGVVGLLITRLCGKVPGVQVWCVERDEGRRELVEALGGRFCSAANWSDLQSHPLSRAADVAINASASQEGLATAIEAVGVEGRVIEASWYGTKQVSVALGGHFHAGRISLVSSQVGRIPPARAPRWDYARRLDTAMRLLDDAALDDLFTSEIALADVPTQLPSLFDPVRPELAIAIRYPAADAPQGGGQARLSVQPNDPDGSN